MSEHDDKIRQRAYEIWEQAGRPHGEDLNHWLQAFKEFGEAEQTPAKKPRAAKAKPAASTEKKAAVADKTDKKTAAKAPAPAAAAKKKAPASTATRH